jgi:N-acyl-D-aspartate/D-glutamate deacylase
MHDLVIRNALLLDGRGSAPVHGDLAVKDGRIAAIGRDPGTARETLDADGLALMPGIIDNHTHYDAQLTWDPAVAPSPALGVTTAIIGNCGFTIAPCRAGDRERIMRNLTQVEGWRSTCCAPGSAGNSRRFPSISTCSSGAAPR